MIASANVSGDAHQVQALERSETMRKETGVPQ